MIAPRQLEAIWHINLFCNYDCTYCYCRGVDKKKLFVGHPDIQKTINAFNDSGYSWHIQISGGEPFFHPQFVELCQGLTERHRLAFNTNLSHKRVFKFAENVDPEKIQMIHCSIHIGELERLNLVESFIEKYKLLRAKDFPLYASYVFYPPFLERFAQDYEFFKSHGIILWPKLYKGGYSSIQIPTMQGVARKMNRAIEKMVGKEYPQDFSKEAKDRIVEFMDRSQRDYEEALAAKGVPLRTFNGLPDVWYDRNILDGIPNFKGRPCRAGKDFVVISETGNLRRCHGEGTGLGNVFDGKIELMTEYQPCGVEECTCHPEGYTYLVDKNN